MEDSVNIDMEEIELGWDGGCTRIPLAQDGNNWRDFVSALMELPVP
jgi:hypothetical protein